MSRLFLKAISGLLGGLIELVVYLNDLQVFSYISQHVVHVTSIPLGIILHLVASVLVFLIGFTIIEKAGIVMKSLATAIVLGLMFGSSVLALFSLPVHLIFIPFKFTLQYLIAHIIYGVSSTLIYWFLKER